MQRKVKQTKNCEKNKGKKSTKKCLEYVNISIFERTFGRENICRKVKEKNLRTSITCHYLLPLPEMLCPQTLISTLLNYNDFRRICLKKICFPF